MTTQNEALIYVQKAGETLGPLSPAKAREQLKQGILHPGDSSVWTGTTAWKPLIDLLDGPTEVVEVPRAAVPVNPLSAIIMMAVDALWTLPEVALTASGIGIPGLILTSLAAFGVTAFAVSRVQAGLAGDEAQTATAKGIGLGILAGLPYPVFGTVAGTFFLAWSGLRKLRS